MWQISKTRIWAELEQQFDWVKRMPEVPQDPVYHAEGHVATHTQMVLDALVQQPAYQSLLPQEQEMLWAAALLHDVEKYSTTVTEPDGRITSGGHAKRGALKTRQILYRDIPTPFTVREQIVGLVRHHGLPLWAFEKSDPAKAVIMASMELNTAWLALLARADVLGRICADQEEMLYKIDCFEALCQEQQCWGQPRGFATAQAKMYYLNHDEAYAGYVPFEEPEGEVILMSGLPGAGKDNYAWQHYRELPVISLDDIRLQRGIAPTDKSGNGRIIQEAKELAKTYLRKKQSFVWNATNITRQMRMQLIDMFLTYKMKVHVVYVEVPYAQLHAQNISREAIVPEIAVEKMIDKLEVPAAWEAHQLTLYVSAQRR